jgi:F-type H+-transporting ATPase subunit delta
MQDPALARKYAKALFDAAASRNAVDPVVDGMESLRSLEVEDAAFQRFLISPEVRMDHKLEFLEAVFRPRVHELVAGLLRLLVEKGRIAILPDLLEEFRILAEEARGIVRIQVETALPLADDQAGRLREELESLSGKQVILEKKTNRALLGGIVVHYHDKILDRSVRRGLKNLSEALRAKV